MVLNFERVARTPHFRSYWVEGNTRDLMSFNAVIADLDRTPGEWRERRSLLRAEAVADRRPAEAAVGEISRYVPAGAGLYRAWARPEITAVVDAFQQVVLPVAAQSPENPNFAPTAGDPDASLGSEQDLETRIDEAPVADDSAKVDLQPLRAALEGNAVLALLEIKSSAPRADGVFTALPAAVAILGERPWNAAAVRSAIESTLGKVWTVAGLGTGFTEAQSRWTMAGLGRVSLAATGNILVIANSDDLLASVLARAGSAPAIGGATYAMRFLHARELPQFERMTRLIDFPALRGGAGDAREPLFFSENIASLGRALGRIDSVSLESHDDGSAVTQTVVYRLR